MTSSIPRFIGNTDQDVVLEKSMIVKKAVEKQGMIAWQYNTVGVSDGITMGHEGKWCKGST